MARRAAHVDMGLLKEPGGGCIGYKYLAHFLGGDGKKFIHGR